LEPCRDSNRDEERSAKEQITTEPREKLRRMEARYGIVKRWRRRCIAFGRMTMSNCVLPGTRVAARVQ
jgi:hypothetical protein